MKELNLRARVGLGISFRQGPGGIVVAVLCGRGLSSSTMSVPEKPALVRAEPHDSRLRNGPSIRPSGMPFQYLVRVPMIIPSKKLFVVFSTNKSLPPGFKSLRQFAKVLEML